MSTLLTLACCCGTGTGFPDPFPLTDPFCDDFERPDVPALGDPYVDVPTGGVSLAIVNGQAFAASPSDLALSAVDATSIFDSAGFYLEALVQVPAVNAENGYVGIRWTSGNGLWQVKLGIWQATTTLIIGDGEGISAIPAGTPGEWVLLRIEIVANDLTADFYLNGVLVAHRPGLAPQQVAGPYAVLHSDLNGVTDFAGFEEWCMGSFVPVVPPLGNHILLEDGFVLLAENGDFLTQE